MKLFKPNVDFVFLNKKYQKDGIYIMPNFMVDMLTLQSVVKTKKNIFNFIIDLDNIFEKYQDNDACKTVIIIRTGGYGDVVALSSIIKYLLTKVENIIFLTEKNEIVKYFDFYDKYIKKRFFVYNFSKNLDKVNLIVENNNIKQNEVKYISYEGVIESNTTDNWYNVFFKQINAIPKQYNKPFLKHIDNNEHIKNYLDKKDVLVTLSSSSFIRSFPLMPVAEAVLEKGYRPVVLSCHLKQPDVEYIYKDVFSLQNKIKVIPIKLNLKDFISLVYYAENVITVDTVTSHLRAGFNKNVNVIYTSFTPDLRTITYKNANNIYINSDCPYQPCFKHTKKQDETCDVYFNNFKHFPFCVVNNLNFIRLKELLVNKIKL